MEICTLSGHGKDTLRPLSIASGIARRARSCRIIYDAANDERLAGLGVERLLEAVGLLEPAAHGGQAPSQGLAHFVALAALRAR